MMKSLLITRKLQNILPHTGWSDSHNKSKKMLSESLSLRRKRSHMILPVEAAVQHNKGDLNETFSCAASHANVRRQRLGDKPNVHVHIQASVFT